MIPSRHTELMDAINEGNGDGQLANRPFLLPIACHQQKPDSLQAVRPMVRRGKETSHHSSGKSIRTKVRTPH